MCVIIICKTVTLHILLHRHDSHYFSHPHNGYFYRSTHDEECVCMLLCENVCVPESEEEKGALLVYLLLN